MRSSAFGVVVAMLAVAGVAEAAHGVRLTYSADPRTTMSVAWNSDSPNDGMLMYGTSPTTLTSTATVLMITQPAPLNNAFTAQITGLAPGTTYYYRVGGAAGVFHPAAGTDPFQFTTHSADPCAPFNFVLIGDNRADFDGMGANALWQDILLETMVHEPQLYVNTGDMVKNGDRADEWISFIDDSEVGWALIPSILTMGNHDEDQINGDGALYNQLYDLPRNSTTGSEDYFSIDVGPVHFVSLNTQFTSPGSSEFTAMVAWLAADLAATTQPWKAVFFHKAVYSRGNHSSGEENNGAINAAFVPLFDQYDVDLVFNGHSHDYERYTPSVGVDVEFGGGGRTFPAGPGGSLPSAVPDGATGTTYMVSGGAGALTTDIFGFTCMDAACTSCLPFGNSCPPEVYDNDVDATVVYDGRHNYGIFAVEGDTMSVQVWTTNAGNTGSAEMIDQFTMTKASFSLMCGMTPPMPDGGLSPGPDAGGIDPPPGPDAGNNGGGADAGGNPVGGDSSGCGCRTTTGSLPAGAALLFVVLLALPLLRRRHP